MTDDFEVWLISWLPGQSTGFHDHGGAAGAFSVVWGSLDEYVATRRGRRRAVTPVTSGEVQAFGPHYVHDVRNSVGRLCGGQRARLLAAAVYDDQVQLGGRRPGGGRDRGSR